MGSLEDIPARLSLDSSAIQLSEKTLPINWDKSGVMMNASAVGSRSQEEVSMSRVEEREAQEDEPHTPTGSSTSPLKRNNPHITASMPDLSQNQSRTVRRRNDSGRATPVKPLSLKEYEKMLEKLQMENFDLKIRIHLYEKMHKDNTPNGTDLLKVNVDLKVAVEEKNKELEYKTSVLEKVVEQLEDLRKKLDSAVDDKNEFEERYSDSCRKVAEMEAQLGESMRKNEELEKDNEHWRNLITLNRIETDSEASSILTGKEREIGYLREQMADMENRMAEERDSHEDAKEEYERKLAELDAQLYLAIQSNDPKSDQELETQSRKRNRDAQEAQLYAALGRIRELEGEIKTLKSHNLPTQKSTNQDHSNDTGTSTYHNKNDSNNDAIDSSHPVNSSLIDLAASDSKLVADLESQLAEREAELVRVRSQHEAEKEELKEKITELDAQLYLSKSALLEEERSLDQQNIEDQNTSNDYGSAEDMLDGNRSSTHISISTPNRIVANVGLRRSDMNGAEQEEIVDEDGYVTTTTVRRRVVRTTISGIEMLNSPRTPRGRNPLPSGRPSVHFSHQDEMFQDPESGPQFSSPANYAPDDSRLALTPGGGATSFLYGKITDLTIAEEISMTELFNKSFSTSQNIGNLKAHLIQLRIVCQRLYSKLQGSGRFLKELLEKFGEHYDGDFTDLRLSFSALEFEVEQSLNMTNAVLTDCDESSSNLRDFMGGLEETHKRLSRRFSHISNQGMAPHQISFNSPRHLSVLEGVNEENDDAQNRSHEHQMLGLDSGTQSGEIVEAGGERSHQSVSPSESENGPQYGARREEARTGTSSEYLRPVDSVSSQTREEDFERLLIRCEELEARNRELLEAADHVAEIRAEFQTIQDQLEDASEHKTRLELECDRLRDNLEASKAAVEAAQSRPSTHDAAAITETNAESMEAVRHECEEMKKTLERERRVREEAETSLAEEVRHLVQAETTIKQLEKERSRLQKEVEDADKYLDERSQDMVEAFRQRLQEEEDQWQEKYSQLVDTHRRELEEAADTVQQLKEKYKDGAETLESVMKEKQHMSDHMKKLLKELEEATAKPETKEVISMTQEQSVENAEQSERIQDLERQLKRECAEAKEMENMVSSLTSSNEKVKRQLETVLGKQKELRSRCRDLEGKCNAFEKQCKKLGEKLLKNEETSREALQGFLKEKEELVETVHSWKTKCLAAQSGAKAATKLDQASSPRPGSSSAAECANCKKWESHRVTTTNLESIIRQLKINNRDLKKRLDQGELPLLDAKTSPMPPPAKADFAVEVNMPGASSELAGKENCNHSMPRQMEHGIVKELGEIRRVLQQSQKDLHHRKAARTNSGRDRRL